jgi:hypothetical protein
MPDYVIRVVPAQSLVIIEINACLFPIKTYLQTLKAVVADTRPTKMIFQLNKLPLKPALMQQQECLLPHIVRCAVVRPEMDIQKLFRRMAQRKPGVRIEMFPGRAQANQFLGI